MLRLRHVPALALALVAAIAPVEARASIDPSEEPSSASVPKEDRPSEKKEDGWEDHDHARIGLLAGVGYPRPLSLEAMVKIERTVGLGVEGGLMPPLTIGPISSSLWGVAGDLRVFPFQGAFFFGVRGGYQRMKATATASVPTVGTLSESAVAEVMFVNPRMGFLWTFESGLTIGLDAGVQVPLKKSYSDTLPESVSAEVRGTLVDVANVFGYSTAPTIDLLRIGFLF